MARISPLTEEMLTVPIREAFEQHVRQYGARITNTKATLAHAPKAFDVYMQWYVLYEEVEKILGKRMAAFFAYSVSHSTDCPLCTTFFRKVIIDSGERPDRLELTEKENNILSFARSIGKCQGHIADHVFNPVARYFSKIELVTLVAFAGQMIATNVFNNVLETDLDDYLTSYLPPVQSIWQHAS